MNPRPFYRWKSFWLGLSVLLFLGWAWERSRQQVDRFTWSGAGEFTLLQINHQESMVEFAWGPGGPYPTPGFFYEAVKIPGTPARWFLARPFENEREFGGGIWFAHWFLVLLFLFPWLAFLFWRVRKLGRLSQ